MIDPNSIKWIIENTPDPKTGLSRGWTIGYLNGHRETVPDDVGAPLAKVMKERGNREYNGQLVTPKGDPLTEVMKTGIRIDQKQLDERVVKKPH